MFYMYFFSLTAIHQVILYTAAEGSAAEVHPQIHGACYYDFCGCPPPRIFWDWCKKIIIYEFLIVKNVLLIWIRKSI